MEASRWLALQFCWFWRNDFWLVKTNAAGLQQWSRAYGGDADDVASSMVKQAMADMP